MSKGRGKKMLAAAASRGLSPSSDEFEESGNGQWPDEDEGSHTVEDYMDTTSADDVSGPEVRRDLRHELRGDNHHQDDKHGAHEDGDVRVRVSGRRVLSFTEHPAILETALQELKPRPYGLIKVLTPCRQQWSVAAETLRSVAAVAGSEEAEEKAAAVAGSEEAEEKAAAVAAVAGSEEAEEKAAAVAGSEEAEEKAAAVAGSEEAEEKAAAVADVAGSDEAEEKMAARSNDVKMTEKEAEELRHHSDRHQQEVEDERVFRRQEREGSRVFIDGTPAVAAHVYKNLNKEDKLRVDAILTTAFGYMSDSTRPISRPKLGRMRTYDCLMFIKLTFSKDDDAQARNEGAEAYKISTAAVDWEAYRSHALKERGAVSKYVAEAYVRMVRARGIKGWYGDDAPEEYYDVVLDRVFAGKPFEFGENDLQYGEPTNDDRWAYEGSQPGPNAVCGFKLLPNVMGDDCPALLASLQEIYTKNPRKTIAWGSDESSGTWSQKIHHELVLTKPEEGDSTPRKTIAFKVSEVVGGHKHKEASSRELQDRRVLADVKLDNDYELVGERSLAFHDIMWRYFKALATAQVNGLTRKEPWKREDGTVWQAAPLAMIRDVALLRMCRDTPSHVDVPEELGGGGDGRVVLNYNANETVLLVFSPSDGLQEPDGTEAQSRYVVLQPGDTWVMQGSYRRNWDHAVFRMIPPAPHLEDIEVAQNRYVLTLRAGKLNHSELEEMYANWGVENDDMQDPNRGEDFKEEMPKPAPPQDKDGQKTPPPKITTRTRAGATNLRERTAGPNHVEGNKGFSAKIDLTLDEKNIMARNSEHATTAWIPGGPLPWQRWAMGSTDSFQPVLSLRSKKWSADTHTMCTGFTGMARVETPSGMEVHEISIGATGIYVAGKTVHRIAVVQAERMDQTGHDAVTGSVNLGSYDKSRKWWPHLAIKNKGHPADKFPDWAVAFMNEKRGGSMATFSPTLGKLLASVVATDPPSEQKSDYKEDGEDDDEGDSDDGDIPMGRPETRAGATHGAPTGGRGVAGVSGGGKPTRTGKAVDKRKLSQMNEDAATGAFKYVKAEVGKFLADAGENLKSLSTMAAQQAELTKLNGANHLRALLDEYKQAPVQPAQTQSDPSVLTFAERMSQTMMQSMLDANVLRAAADEKKDLATIEERRQHSLALAKGDVAQTTRNQMLLAMGMAAGRGNYQQNWHEMGRAPAPQDIEGTPTARLAIALPQAATIGHVPQLALTQQEESTSDDDLETARLVAAVAQMKKKVKAKAMQAALLKELAEGQALLDKSS
jgi:hypothetical protein